MVPTFQYLEHCRYGRHTGWKDTCFKLEVVFPMLGIASNVKGELIYTANNNFVITKLVNRDIYTFHVLA
jgi:hypothetical protein